jgi:hypothetical protein
MKRSFRVAVVTVALAIAAPVRAQTPASTTPPSTHSGPSPTHSQTHHHAMHHAAAPRVSEADQLNRQELAHLQDVGGTPVLRMPSRGKVISK